MLAKTPKTKKTLIKPTEGLLLKLDIGCGERKQDGHIGIDICACPGVDHVMDVRNTPWPIDSDTVDGIWTSHFFEHLDGPERVTFMDECWRVMKEGAQITVVCPYWSSMRAYGDPYHKFPPVCEWTFFYFVEGWREANKLTHYPIKCNFNWGGALNFSQELAAKSDDYKTFAAKNYIGGVDDIHVTLTKLALGAR